MHLNPFSDDFNQSSFVVGVDSFENITIERSTIDKFWYFQHKIKAPGLIKHFILKEGKYTKKSCDITLIKKTSGKFTPRFNFFIWNTTKKAYEEFETNEINKHFIKAKVSLEDSYKNFHLLLEFLESLEDVDLGGSTFAIVERSKSDVLKTLSKSDIEIITKNNISGTDFVNIAYRKQALEIYRKLLNENYLSEYKKLINKESLKDEAVWQFFFNKNPWIFGYGLDYRFQGILQKEFHASGSEGDGSNEVIGDFLLGDKKFTTFVELKKPETKIFGKEKNRSNSWRLSNSLIDSISQILEQKVSGHIKLETSTLHDDLGREIKQKTYDSKTILIIGNWNELSDISTDLERKIKTKTFELFRRDSRNIEIITYDELYERAKFIVEK